MVAERCVGLIRTISQVKPKASQSEIYDTDHALFSHPSMRCLPARQPAGAHGQGLGPADDDLGTVVGTGGAGSGEAAVRQGVYVLPSVTLTLAFRVNLATGAGHFSEPTVTRASRSAITTLEARGPIAADAHQLRSLSRDLHILVRIEIELDMPPQLCLQAAWTTWGPGGGDATCTTPPPPAAETDAGLRGGSAQICLALPANG